MPTLGRQMKCFIFAQRTQDDEFALHLRKSIDPRLVVYYAIVTGKKRFFSTAIEYSKIEFSSNGSSYKPTAVPLTS